MRPANLKTKIFLDSGDVNETREIKKILGFLDGQTTNPTLIAKNPQAQERLARGEKFAEQEVWQFYKKVVEEISTEIPDGSVSVEVYADEATSSDLMFQMGSKIFTWIPNAHIKYPTTKAGLEAAERSIKEGMRVNMTLVFSQVQSAAVYGATLGAKKGEVFVSPFIGRLDDKGENGMDLIKNTLEMYKKSDGHVEVLAASIRNMNHFLGCLSLGVDIITAPFSLLKEWAEAGMPLEGVYNKGELKEIPYQDLDLNLNWSQYDIAHDLTDTGLKKFVEDWRSIIS